VTKEEQEAWKIPPCISNWKNAKGYTIPLDKRLAADGRGLIEHGINPGFASFAESLYLAEQAARSEVEKRASVGQKLAEQQRRQHEENLRLLAEQARLEKSRIAAELNREAALEQAQDHELTGTGRTLAEREYIRQEERRHHERDLRLSRMGPEQRAKYLARESDRDISEKIALGVAQPSAAGQDSMYDQRLFDQTSGIGSGFGDEDSYNLYSKPLFGAGSTAAHLIYKPSFASSQAMDEDNEDQAGGPSGSRKAFQGATETAPRTGPVEFERAPADPFGLDQMLQEAKRQKQ
jgi:SNW domain-containing protein 1